MGWPGDVQVGTNGCEIPRMGGGEKFCSQAREPRIAVDMKRYLVDHLLVPSSFIL